MSDKPMFDGVRVGDKVWSVRHGWGRVYKTDDSDLSVGVRFDNGREDWYTCGGKDTDSDAFPTLFWDEVKIIPPPRPKRKVKKEGWLNIYPGVVQSIAGAVIYSTREDAATDNRIACIHIEWEEEE